MKAKYYGKFINGTCSFLQDNRCFISDVCYYDLEQNVDNHTLLCNASNDALAWSPRLGKKFRVCICKSE